MTTRSRVAKRRPRLAGLHAILLVLATRCGDAPDSSLADGATNVAGYAVTRDRAPPDIVLLVSFDTTRADRVGAYGSSTGATPTLDRFAREGALFEQARAVAPLTMPSHTSMLTGVLPTAHGVRTNGIFTLNEQARTVAEAFTDAGWRTGAFVGTIILDRRYGLAQGFEIYDSPTTEAAGEAFTVIERHADAVVDAALRWIADVKPGERAFLFVHFYDPHSPYEMPHGMQGRFAEPYDAEIAFADAQLGRLHAALADAGRRVAVVMTSDHGESLGAHREATHGIFVYDTTALVPLIVHAPGCVPAGARVVEPVSGPDIAPTLLELAGLDAAALSGATGRSLLLSIEQPDLTRASFCESLLPFHSYRWHPLQALVWNGFKLVQGGSAELYDLAADPTELHDLAATQPERVARMQERLRALVAEGGALGWQGDLALSSEDRATLERLGYAVGGADDDPFDASLPEAKDRIGDLVLAMRARELVQHGRVWMGVDPSSEAALATLTDTQRQQKAAQGRALLLEARELVAQVRAANPRDTEIDKIEGFLLLTLADFKAAIEPLERLVTTDATEIGSRFNLGLCYHETGHDDWAVREMMKTVAIEPRFTKAYEWLAQHHGQKGEMARGAFWLAQHIKHAATPEERARIDRMLGAVTRELRKKGLALDAPPDHPLPERLPEGVLDKMRREGAGGP
ncbi:MAG: hypothetical protein EXS13_07960 [Planctomycetes bacterium]|nr:hypothetical protein [Planctomycetota bacterium]